MGLILHMFEGDFKFLFLIVGLEKPAQATLVHLGTLAERQRFTNEATEPLPDLVVHSLDHAGFAAFHAVWSMLPARRSRNISFVKISVDQFATIALRNTLPEQAASLGASIADSIGNDLTGSPGDN